MDHKALEGRSGVGDPLHPRRHRVASRKARQHRRRCLLKPTRSVNRDKPVTGRAAYKTFWRKYKDIAAIEFKQTGINMNSVKGTMWTRHKQLYGSECDDLCTCALQPWRLADRVIPSRRDKAAINAKYIYTEGAHPFPVRIMSDFAKKKIPKWEHEFPQKTPKELLRLLVKKYHQRVSFNLVEKPAPCHKTPATSSNCGTCPTVSHESCHVAVNKDSAAKVEDQLDCKLSAPSPVHSSCFREDSSLQWGNQGCLTERRFDNIISKPVKLEDLGGAHQAAKSSVVNDTSSLGESTAKKNHLVKTSFCQVHIPRKKPLHHQPSSHSPRRLEYTVKFDPSKCLGLHFVNDSCILDRVSTKANSQPLIDCRIQIGSRVLAVIVGNTRHTIKYWLDVYEWQQFANRQGLDFYLIFINEF